MTILKLKVVLLPILLVVFLVTAMSGQKTTDSERSARIATIRSMPASDVNSIDPNGSPVHIQSASAKELSRTAFKKLTGEPARYRWMSTYPEVVVINVSQKTIASLMIMLRTKAEPPGTSHGLMTKRMSLEPNATYTFSSAKWPKAEKTFVQNDGEFISKLRQPELDSSRSWLPGSASELTVVVVMVVFEDGTQWRVPGDFDF
jgi:hypothetical protein